MEGAEPKRVARIKGTVYITQGRREFQHLDEGNKKNVQIINSRFTSVSALPLAEFRL